MRKAEYFLIVGLVLMNFVAASVVEAFGTGFTTPYGGRVTATTAGNIFCYPGGTGPITISPVGSSPSAFYYFPMYNTKGSHTAPTSSKYVLGNTLPQMVGSCYQQDGPVQVPYPAYKTTLYGVSQYKKY